MEHLLLKAATTAADQGVFEAVISAATVDREKDVVNPHGMVSALQKWVQTGKRIPLAWNHGTKSEDQIGYVDPASARVVNDEVVVKGWIDQSTPAGADAWRMVKMGTLGFSFGFLVPEGGATPRKGGGKNINEFDVFEVTATPTPMNNDTRVLGWKAMTEQPEDDDVSETPLQALKDAIEELQEFASGEQSEGDSTDVAAANRLIVGLRTLMRQEMAQPDDGKALLERADAIAMELYTEGTTSHAKAPEKPADLPEGADWLFPEWALKAARDGELKAVWTTAYINNLPDSAFLYVEPGGEKDSDGKTTPRSLRHFPVRDANGAVDQAHVRNALSRIPQSNLSQNVKDAATAKAQRLLDESKAVRAPDAGSSRPDDPLRTQVDNVILEFASDGESLRRQPPRQKDAPKAEPEFSDSDVDELAQKYMLIALAGEDSSEPS